MCNNCEHCTGKCEAVAKAEIAVEIAAMTNNQKEVPIAKVLAELRKGRILINMAEDGIEAVTVIVSSSGVKVVMSFLFDYHGNILMISPNNPEVEILYFMNVGIETPHLERAFERAIAEFVNIMSSDAEFDNLVNETGNVKVLTLEV